MRKWLLLLFVPFLLGASIQHWHMKVAKTRSSGGFCNTFTDPASITCEDLEGSNSVSGTSIVTAQGSSWTANVSASATMTNTAHENSGWPSGKGSYALEIYIEDGDEEASLLQTYSSAQSHVYYEVAVDMTSMSLTTSSYIGLIGVTEATGGPPLNTLFSLYVIWNGSSYRLSSKFWNSLYGTENKTGTTSLSLNDPFCVQVEWQNSTAYYVKLDAACDGVYESTEISHDADGVADKDIKTVYWGSEQTGLGWDTSYLKTGETATYQMDILAADTTLPGISP